VTCSSCGTENRPGAKFCHACGTALAAVCSGCGAPYAAGHAFCEECGTPLPGTRPAAAPVAQPAAPVAERRLVSVLFADLVGFTTLSEGRDAEEVRELLSRYFDSCRRLIELYGGTVEKFIGDAVMAVWGTPVATEDDAERAVRAALDLVASVAALGDESGVPNLRARAGVLTGEAAVTLGAQGQGMVAGDLVNTASRIQSVATPGTVLVGEATRRACEAAVVFEPAGSFELKGKEGLVPLWRAGRVVSGARGSLKSHGLEAPFVGRDRELRQIKELFHACAEDGRAQLVSVTGIAGIGKSRLAWEFYKYFDGIAQIVYWHRGRCLAYGEGVTYWALADMVRMRCRIGEDEDPGAALGKLRATLDEHLLDAEERRLVEPRLAQLLGLAEQESPERQTLFAAWRLFFERLSDVYPTVLVFEDMHWADASLLDFIEYLLEWSRNHPIFVVTLARPELLTRRPTWGAGLRNFSSLYLEPLSPAMMEHLLEGLVPGLPGEVRERILARAEGVPLYAVETVRMLLDRGQLVQEGAVYRPAGPIGALDVPETLHALIAARLDGLSAEERRLLQAGAVVGKTFARPALAALTGLAGDDMQPLLESLVRKEVLAVQSDPRSPEHGQYGFLQDLVRHVAYETLSRSERRARHLAAAEYLSAAAEEDVAEVVASHLVDAYHAQPDSEGAEVLRARARDALVRAAERAAALAAAAEAQRYYERAVELEPDAAAAAELIDRAGQMAWLAGRSAEARELFDRAHEAFVSGGMASEAALVAGRMGEIDLAEGRLQEAVARIEPALEALAERGEDAGVAVLAAQLGRFLMLSRDERAAVHLERALALAEALGLTETLVHALTSKGTLLTGVDRLREGRVLLEGALGMALAHDLPTAALRAYNNLGVVLESEDRYVECEERIAEALVLARRVGDRQWESGLLGGTLTSLVPLGRWDEALEATANVRALDATFGLFQVAQIVPVHCERGDLGAARAVLGAMEGTESSEDVQVSAELAAARSRLARAEGRSAEAAEHAAAAMEAARALGVTATLYKNTLEERLDALLELGQAREAHELLASLDALRPGELTPRLRAIAARFHGRLAAREGAPEAGEGLAEAEDAYRALEMPFAAAVTQLERAEWLSAQGREAEAAPLLAEARAAFERLRAAPWLERADRLDLQARQTA
jgi:class 3 adenylate cyclase/tetratricopeptide (TPR) repeat protein